jgi:3'(2'), 5'-bisphosphate nucleotidase/myo-inositol-1(or 4)-monophosphatase
MLDQVEALLVELGSKLLDWRQRGLTDGHWEGPQLKAEADRRAHEFLYLGLGRLWPGITVISEEDVTTHSAQRPAEYWLIDPIDGTASYCGGYEGFITQVALMRGYRPQLGVVHAPALNLTYAATEHGPALCNRQQVRVSKRGEAGPVLIDNYPKPRGFADVLFHAIGCSRYIESGSIGLKICKVADGTADLFAKDVVVRDWDLAPADLILQRAGGYLTTLAGDSIPYRGEFARKGVIAAASQELVDDVINWNRTRPITEKP